MIEGWEWAAVLGVPLGAVWLLRHLPVEKIEESNRGWANAAARAFREDVETVKRKVEARADALEKKAEETARVLRGEMDSLNKKSEKVINDVRAHVEETATALRGEAAGGKAETSRAMESIRAETSGAVEEMDRKMAGEARRLDAALKASGHDGHPTYHPGFGDFEALQERVESIGKAHNSWANALHPRLDRFRAFEAAAQEVEDAENWLRIEPGPPGFALYLHRKSGETRKLPDGWTGDVAEGYAAEGTLTPVGVEGVEPVPLSLYLAHFRRGAKSPRGTAPPEKPREPPGDLAAQLDAAPGKKPDTSGDAETILRVLKDAEGWLSRAAVAERAGLPERRARRALEDLKATGLAESGAYGWRGLDRE